MHDYAEPSILENIDAITTHPRTNPYSTKQQEIIQHSVIHKHRESIKCPAHTHTKPEKRNVEETTKQQEQYTS